MIDGYIEHAAKMMREMFDEFVCFLHIPGAPIPQPRHRVGRNGAYIPDDHPVREWRQAIRRAAKAAFPVPPKLECPLAIGFEFVLPHSPSHLREDGTLKPRAPRMPIGARTGDLDNLVKPLKDMMEKWGIYKNDAQVCVYPLPIKRFVSVGEEPHASVTIFTLKQE